MHWKHQKDHMERHSNLKGSRSVTESVCQSGGEASEEMAGESGSQGWSEEALAVTLCQVVGDSVESSE